VNTPEPSIPNPRRHRFPISLTTLIVLMAITSLPLAWLVAFAARAFTWRSTMREFPKNSWKVSDVVEAVHGHRKRTGAWPATLSTAVPGRADERDREGWRYKYFPPPADVATLEMSGPLHMQLRYVFSCPISTSGTSGWSCTCEGDPMTVPPPPTPSKTPSGHPGVAAGRQRRAD
jgi:hypothetical protein